MSGDFNILFVCTGNICRSATAVQMLDHKLTNFNVVIDSAGTHALNRSDMPPQAKQVLDELRFPLTPHVSKQLTSSLLENTQLVLTATAEHRSDVVRTLVKANRFTYTILEFAELIKFVENPGDSDFEVEVQSKTLEEKLQVVASARGYINSNKDRDIPDPFTRELNDYRLVGDLINEATDTIAKWINE
jgi:protein-tyrosine phosphatase